MRSYLYVDLECKKCGRKFKRRKDLASKSTKLGWNIYCSFSCRSNTEEERSGIYPRRFLEKFWANVDKTVGQGPNGDCWVWKGAKLSGGYGQIRYREVVIRAHRLSFTLVYGPIPDNLVVLHKCDNKPCVNPDHLFMGTFAMNSKDMTNKGRQEKGEDRHCSKLKEPQVLEIRRRYSSGEGDTYQLAREFNVRQGTIWYIVSGKTWKHLLPKA